MRGCWASVLPAVESAWLKTGSSTNAGVGGSVRQAEALMSQRIHQRLAAHVREKTCDACTAGCRNHAGCLPRSCAPASRGKPSAAACSGLICHRFIAASLCACVGACHLATAASASSPAVLFAGGTCAALLAGAVAFARFVVFAACACFEVTGRVRLSSFPTPRTAVMPCSASSSTRRDRIFPWPGLG